MIKNYEQVLSSLAVECLSAIFCHGALCVVVLPFKQRHFGSTVSKLSAVLCYLVVQIFSPNC